MNLCLQPVYQAARPSLSRYVTPRKAFYVYGMGDAYSILQAPKKEKKDMDEDDKAFLEKKRAGEQSDIIRPSYSRPNTNVQMRRLARRWLLRPVARDLSYVYD
jgi:hypothetical protein